RVRGIKNAERQAVQLMDAEMLKPDLAIQAGGGYARSRLFDHVRRPVDGRHTVAGPCEPFNVGAGAAPKIEDAAAAGDSAADFRQHTLPHRAQDWVLRIR